MGVAAADKEAREALQPQRRQLKEYPEEVTQTLRQNVARALRSEFGESARSRTIGTSAMLLRLCRRCGKLRRCKTCRWHTRRFGLKSWRSSRRRETPAATWLSTCRILHWRRCLAVSTEAHLYTTVSPSHGERWLHLRTRGRERRCRLCFDDKGVGGRWAKARDRTDRWAKITDAAITFSWSFSCNAGFVLSWLRGQYALSFYLASFFKTLSYPCLIRKWRSLACQEFGSADGWLGAGD